MAEQKAGRRRWYILGVMIISLLVIVLDNTVLNVALKTIAEPHGGLGASQAELEWAVNSYTLVFAGLLFSAGVIGDRVGRRRVMMAGLGVFGIASLLCAYSRSPGQLVAARAAMGLGAAVIMPQTLSIITNVFEAAERPRAIGIWASAVGLAVAIGPVTGGLLSVAGLILLSYGIIQGGDAGWRDPGTCAPLGAGLGLIAAFGWHEARIPHPSLSVRLLRDARLSCAVAAIALAFFPLAGVLFFTSFYLQDVRGYAPWQAGLLMLPFAAGQLLFAPRSAAMVRRFGAKIVCATGLLLIAAALAGYELMGAATSIWVLGVIFFVLGAGLAHILPPANECLMSALPREQAGSGSGLNSTARQVAEALGVAVLGSVLSAVYRRQMNPRLAFLAAPARAAAGESISGTLTAIQRLGPSGARLTDPARTAFVGAMHVALAVAAIVALAGAAVVVAWMPGTAAARGVGWWTVG